MNNTHIRNIIDEFKKKSIFENKSIETLMAIRIYTLNSNIPHAQIQDMYNKIVHLENVNSQLLKKISNLQPFEN
jgi:hypothetical protein